MAAAAAHTSGGDTIYLTPLVKGIGGILAAIITAGTVAAVGGLWVSVSDGKVLAERTLVNARDMEQVESRVDNLTIMLNAIQISQSTNMASLAELRTIAAQHEKAINEARDERHQIEERLRSNEVGIYRPKGASQ